MTADREGFVQGSASPALDVLRCSHEHPEIFQPLLWCPNCGAIAPASLPPREVRVWRWPGDARMTLAGPKLYALLERFETGLRAWQRYQDEYHDIPKGSPAKDFYNQMVLLFNEVGPALDDARKVQP